MRKRDEANFLVISLIASIICLWTKNEGTLLVSIILFMLILDTAINARDIKKDGSGLVFGYVLSVLVFAAGWNIFKSRLGLVNENFNPAMLKPCNIIPGLSKIPAVVYRDQKELFGLKKWNIFWVLFIAILSLRFKAAFSKKVRNITFIILLFASSYTLMYMFSSVEIGYFVRVTASRFLLHVFPVAFFWMVIVLEDKGLAQKS